MDTVNRYRITAYFILTALVSITVALLVVNQDIGGIAEENLTRMAEKNAVRNSIHMQAMLRGGSGSGMRHTGMPMANMQSDGAMTEGMQHTGMPMADMQSDRATTEGMNEEAVVQDERLTLEFLAGPQGLSRQYFGLVQGLGLVGLELLDLDRNSLWSSDPESQSWLLAANFHYQLD